MPAEGAYLHRLENRLWNILCALIICFTHLRQQWAAQAAATGRADNWLQPPAEQEWPFCSFSLYLQRWEQEGRPLLSAGPLSSQPAPSHHCHSNTNCNPETSTSATGRNSLSGTAAAKSWTSHALTPLQQHFREVTDSLLQHNLA